MINEISNSATKEVLKISGVHDLINALIEMKFGEQIMHAKILRSSRDEYAKCVTDQLNGKVNVINKDLLYNPIGSDQEPLFMTAFDLLKNSISSEHYRNLFTNLIASAFDMSKHPELHPSFPFIIQQLTPLDAKIISDISKKSESYTFGLSYSMFNEAFKKSDSFFDYYLIKNENMQYEDIELTNISINNLVSQGLIQLEKIDFDKPLPQIKNIDQDEFDRLMKQYIRFNQGFQGGGTNGPLSKITITRLGKSFLDVCLND